MKCQHIKNTIFRRLAPVNDTNEHIYTNSTHIDLDLARGSTKICDPQKGYFMLCPLYAQPRLVTAQTDVNDP